MSLENSNKLPRKYSVYLFFSREKKLILTDKKYWVNWDEKLKESLLEVCKEDDLSIVNQ